MVDVVGTEVDEDTAVVLIEGFVVGGVVLRLLRVVQGTEGALHRHSRSCTFDEIRWLVGKYGVT